MYLIAIQKWSSWLKKYTSRPKVLINYTLHPILNFWSSFVWLMANTPTFGVFSWFFFPSTIKKERGGGGGDITNLAHWMRLWYEVGTSRHVQKMNIVEMMRMLIWTCEHTKSDKISSRIVPEKVKWF